MLKLHTTRQFGQFPVHEAVVHINALERKLKERIAKMKWCFVEPDVVD
ncbi:MAG: hypothetical protein KJO01_07100 [Gammaproteobacteria bacterium]|nr:hypothetical protein [Gammaproteobacteria bacterium]MBT8110837.1 hypothetical protein [Gammaproteobacteria bacterium]NNL45536.1 hypothetical protein [Woeseiaceae bacterium]